MGLVFVHNQRSRTVKFNPLRLIRLTRTRRVRASSPGLAAATQQLLTEHPRVRHQVTVQQARAYLELDGIEPCSYDTNPVRNWLPEHLTVEEPHALCFAADGDDLVVLGNGTRFFLGDRVIHVPA